MTDRVNPNTIKTMTMNDKDVFVFPGFVDVHVHLREPGFCYKETVATGTASAAAGGFTCILSMPNLNPCPDSIENLKVQQDAIDKDAIVKTLPYGAITVGEKGEVMADIDGLADKVVAFTDDGVGVMNDDYMEEAMIKAKKYGMLVVAHCEDNNYPRESSEAEYKQLARDLELVRKTGCSYHMCHVSTKESVELIRQAKAEGLDVTCETAAHYLLLTRDDVFDAIAEMANGGRPAGRFKMNPPIKFEEDRQALIEAIKDGTIDMLATDHAPHGADEKNQEFEKCAFGIIGLETAFPVLYTGLVKEGIITLEELINLMAIAPAKRFNLPVSEGDYTVWDLDEEYVLDPETFLTMGRATPFDGWKVNGRCLKTYVDGKEVYSYDR